MCFNYVTLTVNHAGCAILHPWHNHGAPGATEARSDARAQRRMNVCARQRHVHSRPDFDTGLQVLSILSRGREKYLLNLLCCILWIWKSAGSGRILPSQFRTSWQKSCWTGWNGAEKIQSRWLATRRNVTCEVRCQKDPQVKKSSAQTGVRSPFVRNMILIEISNTRTHTYTPCPAVRGTQSFPQGFYQRNPLRSKDWLWREEQQTCLHAGFHRMSGHSSTNGDFALPRTPSLPFLSKTLIAFLRTII